MESTRRSTTCRVLLAALILAALTACGGGGGGGGGGGDGQTLEGNFFPLGVGDRWVYTAGDGSPVTVRATGTRTVDGSGGIVVATADPTAGDSEAVYVVTSSAVREVPGAGTDPLIASVGTVDVMHLPLVVGDSFVQIDKTIVTGEDFDGDGRIEQAAVRSDVTVVGVETAVTPAGSYSGCVHLRTLLTARVQLTSTNQTVTVVMTMDDWYAPNIGPVRSTVSVTSEGRTETQALGIAAFEVGGRRSESVAPTVVSVTPADGGTLGASPIASVTFSEPVDAASVAAAFTLVDAAGHLLPSTVQVSGRTATLVPNVGLPTGRYGLRLAATVEDWAGNPLASALSWSFDVDLTGPVLVSSTPADNATDVALDARLVLRFSEAVDPASFTAGVLTLSDGWNYLPISIAIDGTVVTLTPAAPLMRAQAYELDVNAQVRDLAGNAMNTTLRLHFRADAGRFAAPVELMTAGTIEAVAVGDVDGDGRADAVFATNAFSTPSFQLAVRAQRPDGSLGAAQWIATRASYVCPIRSIALGDLDGDGRTDLVVGESGCGIEFFRQGADGQLRAAEFIDSPESGTVRLADLNGDGRPDLVAAGYYGTVLRVWLQAADGAMVEHAGPAFVYGGSADLAVGDLNGDGRPDIVAISRSGDPAASIGIALQQADGSFGVVQTRGVPGGDWPDAVAIGDVNGDGRADLVLTYGGNAAWLGVMLQQPGGTLGAMTSTVTYDSPSQLEIADVNGDGRLDVVVGHSGWMAVGVNLQQLDGSLAAEVRYPGPYGTGNADALALGDLNGDGRPDVLVAESLLVQRAVDTYAQGIAPTPNAAIAAWLRKGPGAWR